MYDRHGRRDRDDDDPSRSSRKHARTRSGSGQVHAGESFHGRSGVQRGAGQVPYKDKRDCYAALKQDETVYKTDGRSSRRSGSGESRSHPIPIRGIADLIGRALGRDRLEAAASAVRADDARVAPNLGTTRVPVGRGDTRPPAEIKEVGGLFGWDAGIVTIAHARSIAKQVKQKTLVEQTTRLPPRRRQSGRRRRSGAPGRSEVECPKDWGFPRFRRAAIWATVAG
jgi:hypothetical protein